jgi:branched-chain amino acid transport system permease protein
MDVLNALTLFANFVFIPATAYGAQLALGALGLTVIYSILRFSNIAHGDMMAFGTAVTILVTWLFQGLGLGFGPLPTALLALPFGIAAAVAVSLLTDRWVYRYYRRVRVAPVVLMMVSIGVMFVMNGINRFILGTEEIRFDDGARFLVEPKAFKEWSGLAEGLAIRSTQALTLGVALVVVAALFWFLQRTRTGKAMRAYSDNEDLALLSGINPDRVVLIAWVLATTLATIAGVLYGLDKSYKAFTYFQILLPIFAAAIVGGIGSPVGAVIGGFIVAYSEVMVTYAYKKFLTYLLPADWAPEGLTQLLTTEYKVAVSFVILVLVLLVRPTGLFRGKVI